MVERGKKNGKWERVEGKRGEKWRGRWEGVSLRAGAGGGRKDSGQGDRDAAVLGSWAEKGLEGRLRGRGADWDVEKAGRGEDTR